MVNLTVVGTCANDTTHILCTNGANLVFYNIPSVVIKMVSFQGCGEQLQHSALDSVPDSSTLYFQNCKTIMIHHVLINITSPYRRGIAFIRHNTSITHGNVVIEPVSIHHSGIHGSGLHFEVLTVETGDAHASLASERVLFDNIEVYNERAYPECGPTIWHLQASTSQWGKKEEVVRLLPSTLLLSRVPPEAVVCHWLYLVE